MPETKGLSLLQIREMYLGKDTTKDTRPNISDAKDAEEMQKTLSSTV
jgi:hypothetical protein